MRNNVCNPSDLPRALPFQPSLITLLLSRSDKKDFRDPEYLAKRGIVLVDDHFIPCDDAWLQETRPSQFARESCLTVTRRIATPCIHVARSAEEAALADYRFSAPDRPRALVEGALSTWSPEDEVIVCRTCFILSRDVGRNRDIVLPPDADQIVWHMVAK